MNENPYESPQVNLSDSEAKEQPRSTLNEMRTAEDWWAIWCGGFLLLASFLAVWLARPTDLADRIANKEKVKITSPLSAWLSAPGKWDRNPLDSFYKPANLTDDDKKNDQPFQALPGIFGAFVAIAAVIAVAQQVRKGEGLKFLIAFPIVFLLAVFSYILAAQSVIKASNLEYALWALLVGLIISNTIGTPAFLKPAALTELFIKTGLVMFGAEVLLNRLLALGLPGIFVSWVVTPITLITTYAFGQKILKMESRSLNMVISADMSVCGVSAAIATAAACKAKKEELSLAIGLSLAFTVVMMIVMPMFIKAVGMDEVLGGAWLGGTIDSTGAVSVAGAMLGKQALEVASTVKMIQNVLIGVISFGVATYWVTSVERDPSGRRPSLMEIWRRFPKFVLGFVFASLVFTTLFATLTGGPELIDGMVSGSTTNLRGWFFCLAFVSIGLETNFRELAPYFKGGKPLILYVCGQALNLCLTLFMAWLMFHVVFRGVVEEMIK